MSDLSPPGNRHNTGRIKENPMYVLERKDGKFQAVQTYKDPLSEKTRKVTVTID